ncbi:MAG: hypothetical protein HYX68_06935 [Planctomycetes bacterium]|nr:hypothetical protein [Planctomycetota bacterium]
MPARTQIMAADVRHRCAALGLNKAHLQPARRMEKRKRIVGVPTYHFVGERRSVWESVNAESVAFAEELA